MTTSAGSVPPVNPSRYHVTLSSAGRPVQHGWWGSESTARSKSRDWVGSGGADARVGLVDEGTGGALHEWPETLPGHLPLAPRRALICRVFGDGALERSGGVDGRGPRRVGVVGGGDGGEGVD